MAVKPTLPLRTLLAKNVVAARPDILCRSGNNRSAKCSFCVAMRRPCFLFPPCDIRDVAARYQEELLKERPDEAILALLQPAASAAVGRGDSSKNDVQYTAALQHVREMEEQRSRPTESNELELPQVAEEVAWLRKEVAALREDLEALREVEGEEEEGEDHDGGDSGEDGGSENEKVKKRHWTVYLHGD
ncbi:hypothetical protein ACRE_057660 [Hapsidospora chrysogenum ATCC 11550]|uniref:Uncharacterized protein n=1 Tax=Hapsidospora chrysogenum (strain ATCC 11550 / CBS 779.69 / DSM 880 / IAM 14645 / JCM 23072 / IMI 49137) TaxID=857340 RepID=A0A086T291_HAPC1|nr:hypothetical protein ACRE_057660 [Hapsidospora chrysogenum ATCC 11550]